MVTLLSEALLPSSSPLTPPKSRDSSLSAGTGRRTQPSKVTLPWMKRDDRGQGDSPVSCNELTALGRPRVGMPDALYHDADVWNCFRVSSRRRRITKQMFAAIPVVKSRGFWVKDAPNLDHGHILAEYPRRLHRLPKIRYRPLR